MSKMDQLSDIFQRCSRKQALGSDQVKEMFEVLAFAVRECHLGDYRLKKFFKDKLIEESRNVWDAFDVRDRQIGTEIQKIRKDLEEIIFKNEDRSILYSKLKNQAQNKNIIVKDQQENIPLLGLYEEITKINSKLSEFEKLKDELTKIKQIQVQARNKISQQNIKFMTFIQKQQQQKLMTHERSLDQHIQQKLRKLNSQFEAPTFLVEQLNRSLSPKISQQIQILFSTQTLNTQSQKIKKQKQQLLKIRQKQQQKILKQEQKMRKLITSQGKVDNWTLASNITQLILKDQGFVRLPRNFGDLSNLQNLDLRYNSLNCLPDSFGLLVNLRQLKLTSNLFQQIPKWIFQLKALQHLGMGYNKIKKLDNKIGELSQLQLLGLNNNPIGALPAQICKLQKLTKLYLSDMLLTTLPPQICSLTSLTILNVKRNKLITLPPDIKNLTNLSIFQLTIQQNSQINISDIPIDELISLKQLHIDCNKDYPDNIVRQFGDLCKMKKIDVACQMPKKLIWLQVFGSLG